MAADKAQVVKRETVRQRGQRRPARLRVSVSLASAAVAYFSAMEPPVNDAADELLRTYTESGGINYLDAAAMLPSRPAIESACVDLMSLMFPGFHGAALADSSDLPDVTRSRIKSLHTRMKPEISKSFGQLPRARRPIARPRKF